MLFAEEEKISKVFDNECGAIFIFSAKIPFDFKAVYENEKSKVKAIKIYNGYKSTIRDEEIIFTGTREEVYKFMENENLKKWSNDFYEILKIYNFKHF